MTNKQDERVREEVARLREAFKQDDNVLLAYLFGSRVRGKPSRVSDYDIAVLLKDNSLESIGRVLFTASEALKVNEDYVDLMDLARAPMTLKARVLAEGIKFDRGYGHRLRLEVNIKYPEIARQTRGETEEWLRNPGSINLELIRDRLGYLTHLGEHVRLFLGRHRIEELSRDFEAWHALKSMIQDSVQAMIDVCAHLFSVKDLGVASSYRDYVKALTSSGYMERNLAEELELAIVVRNRLNQRYLTVSPEEPWNFAVELASKTIPKFREWVLQTARPQNP